MSQKYYRTMRLRGDFIDCHGACRIVLTKPTKGKAELLIISEDPVSPVQMPIRVGRKPLRAVEIEAAD